MSDSSPVPRRTDSYLGVVTNLGAVLLTLAALGLFGLYRSTPKPKSVELAPNSAAPSPDPDPSRVPAPTPPPAPPTLDREAVARAEAAVASARRDRLRAEDGVAEAEAALKAATIDEAQAQASARSLASRVRYPGARIQSATTRGGQARAEIARIKAELAALDGSPKPHAKPLTDQSPVARTAEGDEFHFEIRQDRIAFIDLERLLDRVKTDARMRLRLGDGVRPIDSVVGPVGAFAMRYQMGPSPVGSFSELIRERSPTYTLTAWEIVPNRDRRGESYEMAMSPASEFSRAVNRLNPRSATITIWVYPDGFPLYRKVRDLLHDRGFLVAARPLPDGMAIRGSPSGSISAGQ